jgi:hypothetical protein
VTVTPGTLVVEKAALVITADDATRQAGQPNPAFSARYQGLVLGEESGVLTTPVVLTTTATAKSPAGAYAIVPSGATATNYSITFASGTLTVTSGPPAPGSSPPTEVGSSSVPPPVVLSVRLVTNAGTLRLIRINVSGALVKSEAQDTANSQLSLPGRDRKLGTRDDQIIRPRSASYDAATGIITLTPRRLVLKSGAELRIVSAGLKDSHGQSLDGDGNGQPGGDYLTRLTRRLVAVTKSRFSARHRRA